MARRLTAAEASALRSKPLYADVDHFIQRCLTRAPFAKTREAIFDGDLYLVGRHKYRAVIRWKGRVLFVIFKDEGEYLSPITVGVTSEGKRRWG